MVLIFIGLVQRKPKNQKWFVFISIINEIVFSKYKTVNKERKAFILVRSIINMKTLNCNIFFFKFHEKLGENSKSNSVINVNHGIEPEIENEHS